MKKKNAKKVKMHKFLACACKSQDFAQGQKNLRGRTTTRPHVLETLLSPVTNIQYSAKKGTWIVNIV